MNKVFLSGNLTRDVELKVSQQNKAFARTGIAVKRPFNKDAVDFFYVVAFGKTAEFMDKYFAKGSRVLIEGQLHSSQYEKNGAKLNSTDVLIDVIEFADSKKKDDKPADKPDYHDDAPDLTDDDFPFQ